MAARVLVDSSFFIDRLRADLDPTQELGAASDAWELLTCGVVQVEVLRGMKESKGHARMKEFLGCMLYVPTLNSVWERTARLAWELDRRGRRVNLPDLTIAACALEAECAVLTFDSDFAMIPGIRTLRMLA